MTFLLFASALALSAVAAWYAVAGLIAIFAASVIPIAIMGSLLEAAKLVVASWLYRSWAHIPVLMRLYFSAALVTLMLLTSMGIFGFLSKAHLDQAVPTGESLYKLENIDEQIKTQKENLNANRNALSQLDSQVSESLNRTTGASGAAASVRLRRSQQSERATIAASIAEAQTQIASLQSARAPLASEVRKIQAEVGPIKYIAELIYGQEASSETVLEKAVRFVILMIVVVFDPLAVLMLIAANWQMKRDAAEEQLVEAPRSPLPSPPVEPDTVEERPVSVRRMFRHPPPAEPVVAIADIDSLKSNKG